MGGPAAEGEVPRPAANPADPPVCAACLPVCNKNGKLQISSTAVDGAATASKSRSRGRHYRADAAPKLVTTAQDRGDVA